MKAREDALVREGKQRQLQLLFVMGYQRHLAFLGVRLGHKALWHAENGLPDGGLNG